MTYGRTNHQTPKQLQNTHQMTM